MSERKKLIEVALPLEAINEASAREKSIRHGHPSTLHLWWARRPLAAARAVIFASLVDDPDHPNAPAPFVEACRKLDKGKNAQVEDTPRRRLFDFIEELVKWESTTNERVIGKARELILLATEGNPPPLLDPFAGGGSIPLEAQRLGLEAHASDLNPVAVMINKAQIEIPPRFANRPPVNPDDRAKMGSGVQWKGAAGLAADVRYYGEWMRQKAWEKIGHLYPTHNGETVIAWLWARTVRCPNPACGADMPLITSFEISKKKGRRAWIQPKIDRVKKSVIFIVVNGEGQAPNPPKMGRGAKFRCIVCEEIAPDQHIKDEGMAKRLGAKLMAIVTDGQGGRSYYSPNPTHEAILQQAKPQWYPNGELADDPRNIWCRNYGLIEFSDLFTPRQLVALTTFTDLVAKVREQAHEDARKIGLADDDVPLRDGGCGGRAYAEAISVYLAFALDKGANLWSSLVSWMSDRGAFRETFARQALPMVWDYAEANPFSTSNGNFEMFLGKVAEAIEFLPTSIADGIVLQQDARNVTIMHENIIVSTDPPYYDNIGYADLSDFFYIWTRRCLQNLYPAIFSTVLVPKSDELIASPYRFNGNKRRARDYFEEGLSGVFARLKHYSTSVIPVTIYYAFRQTETSENSDLQDINVSTGWETILSALVQTGFSIDGTWPIRTEGSGRIIALGTNALASSIVLVCRPRLENAKSVTRRQFVDELRREIPAALENLQSGNIAPVDLAQASIGPGMAIYSRYSQVREADGSPLSVRVALGLINQELDAYLNEQDGDLDVDSRFAVAWFQIYGYGEGIFGDADNMARAKNTSVEGVKQAGIVTAERGKVKLVPWRDYDPGAWDPRQDRRATIWEAVHHLIERLEHHGNEGAALLYNRMNATMAAEARQLAYRLYNICERKGWAAEARDYNTLVALWPDLVNDAVRLREQGIGQSAMDLGL